MPNVFFSFQGKQKGKWLNFNQNLGMIPDKNTPGITQKSSSNFMTSLSRDST